MALPVSANLPQGTSLQGAQTTSLQLQPGQVVEARVVAGGQGGSTQLVLGNQVVDVALQVKLQEGALVRLLVQATTPSVRLAVLPQQQAPAQTASPQLSLPATPQGAATAPTQALPSTQGPSAGHGQLAVHTAPATQATGGNAGAVRTAAAPSVNSPTSSATTRQAAAQPRVQVTAQPLRSAQSPSTPVPSAVVHGAATSGRGAAGQQAPVQTLPPGTVLQLQTGRSGAVLKPVLVPVPGLQQGAALQQGQSALPRPVHTAGSVAQGGAHSQQAQPAATQSVQALAVPPLQQAIVQTAQAAVARQDSISALLVSLAGLGGKQSELPRPVAQAGAELLGARLKLDGKPLDGAGLKQAIQRSGVLLESVLAKGAPAQQGDIKSGLLKLVGSLRSWVGSDAPQRAESGNRPAPPTGGTPPRAERPASQSTPPDLPAREAGVRLLAQADAALSRLRLTQMSSLPDSFARGGQPPGPPPELNAELPLMLGGELGIGHFQVLRDGKNDSGRDEDGAWKMRFSINFSQTGEVGATVSLRGRRVGVMLWAEREEIAAALEGAADELQSALEARGLEPGAIRCRHGHPPQAKAPAGYFMDDCS